MNDATRITSPGNTIETVGNLPNSLRVAERVQESRKDANFSLRAVWTAFQSTALPRHEKSSKPLTNPQISLYDSHYGTLIPNAGSGEGIVSSCTVVQVLDYYPFGDERIDNQTGGVDEQRKFADTERDTETGLDYAQNRYYANERGQFISIDLVFWSTGTTLQNGAPNSTSGSGLSPNTTSGYRPTSGMGRSGPNPEQMAWLADPQAQNSYSYARNNPIVNKDPDGLFFQTVVIPFLARQTLGSVVRGLLSGTADILTGIDVYEGYVTNFDSTSRTKLGVDGLLELVQSRVNKYEKALINAGTIMLEGLDRIPTPFPQTSNSNGSYLPQYYSPSSFSGGGSFTPSQSSAFSNLFKAFTPSNSGQSKALENVFNVFSGSNSKK